MATPADLARGWMQKGDSDRLNADRTVQTPGPMAFWPDQAVAQQALMVVARVRAAVLSVLPAAAQP